ncbi:MAG: site-specific DNA-methyltransferase [Oscillospiraceae bacterium]|jgi:DNA modification methylase|nr:site-specific DNA-methyltransferase [Oscillospiraceae bacterium]
MSKPVFKARKIPNGFSCVESRWARLGPYYAMFPIDFAFDVISHYSGEGDFVLDPFAGRGSGNFVAATLGRRTLGIEINPVAWLYGATKLSPAPKNDVINRLNDIVTSSTKYKEEQNSANLFFSMCFSGAVLRFLLAARNELKWKTDKTDSTLMAIILHYLHGKRMSSLSNQMPMAKSTSTQYSIKWWKNKSYENPPEIDVLAFLQKRIEWRYGKETIDFSDRGRVVLDDSTKALNDIYINKIDLLFTSPPYYAITNYFSDQWLRLWLLGGAERPIALREEHKNRFNSMEAYENLLDIIFGKCANMLSPKGAVYVRTDYRKFTLETTKKVLKKHFPSHQMSESVNLCRTKSQTEFLNNSKNKVREVDLVLTT